MSVVAPGCSIFRPSSNALPEYDAAKRSVESYQDAEGNWVRPEGVRAEKKKNTELASSLSWIPGLGGQAVDKVAARQAFSEGDALFEQAKNAEGDERVKLFKAAGKNYKEAAKNWQSSALEQDSLFMAGESYFFAEAYPDAEQFYVRLVKEYPRTPLLDKADQRRMEIALYWLQYDAADPHAFYELNLTDRRRPWNDTGRRGVNVLEKMRLDNPTGRLADDATMELATEAFRKAKFPEARDTFEDLRITYPDSPHQFQAHFLGLKASLETYQGPQYGVEPLDEAEKLIKRILKQFPDEAADQREYLNRAYAEVRYMKSERLYDQARFRMNRGENNAAKHYLDQILVEFSDTPFADKARDAQATIEPLPGEPKPYFKWLADQFPENSKTKPLLESKAENDL